MMLVLQDDGTLELFAGPDQPPDWIEGIDAASGATSSVTSGGSDTRG
ncbi:MAG: hypothetical protein K6T86_04600 [Pirellulales bacterium]|nr:hypothetical protein [Pirellulales bacterium]